jgi:cephalosporin hydroxylase
MNIRSALPPALLAAASKISGFIGSKISGPSNPVRNPECSEFEVDGWNLSRFIVSKLVPVVGIHPFPLQELMLMSAAVVRLRPSLIFEWGTNIGKSARIFYEVANYYSVPLIVHSIDLPDEIDHVEHPRSGRGFMVRKIKAVKLHQGDGLTTSLRLWQEAGSPSRPMFFIDGDHSYESVKRELEGIVAAVPDPFLLLHDTFFQSSEAAYNLGPYTAIEEFLGRYPGRFSRVQTGFSLPGMTLLIPVSIQL